jgi:hypothetical protein
MREYLPHRPGPSTSKRTRSPFLPVEAGKLGDPGKHDIHACANVVLSVYRRAFSKAADGNPLGQNGQFTSTQFQKALQSRQILRRDITRRAYGKAFDRRWGAWIFFSVPIVK